MQEVEREIGLSFRKQCLHGRRRRSLTRKSVRPAILEAVVCAQVNDDATLTLAPLRAAVDSVDERLADPVRERHDPRVDLAVLLHTLDILNRQIAVLDGSLRVVRQRIARELTGRDMREVQVGV